MSSCVCERCGSAFSPTKSIRRFCSERCRRGAEQLRWQRRYPKPRTRTPGTVLFRCEECGDQVLAPSRGALPSGPYCGKCRRRSLTKAWIAAHPEKHRMQARDSGLRASRKRRQNPYFRLAGAVSAQIRASLKGLKHGNKWEALIGCTESELRLHLERQFLPGMSWANYGRWHLEHIRPVASFQFEAATDEGFKACWSLSNLRPLWAVDNLKKGGRVTLLL